MPLVFDNMLGNFLANAGTNAYMYIIACNLVNQTTFLLLYERKRVHGLVYETKLLVCCIHACIYTYIGIHKVV